MGACVNSGREQAFSADSAPRGPLAWISASGRRKHIPIPIRRVKQIQAPIPDYRGKAVWGGRRMVQMNLQYHQSLVLIKTFPKYLLSVY